MTGFRSPNIHKTLTISVTPEIVMKKGCGVHGFGHGSVTFAAYCWRHEVQNLPYSRVFGPTRGLCDSKSNILLVSPDGW